MNRSTVTEDFQIHILKELQCLRSEVASLKEMLGKEEISEEIIPNLAPVALEVDLTSRISNLLREMSIPAHIKGYGYLREAILMVYNDFTLLSKITKVLYPTIASNNKDSMTRVERAIRHAIETSYFKNLKFFPDKKPTNSEFIAYAADLLRVQDGKVS